MKFAHLASRVAVGGVAAALATAGLVATTGTSASAAPVSTTYTCALPQPLGNQQFPVTVDIALLPASAPAGYPVPQGLLSFKSSITVPPAVVAALGTSANGAKSDDFSTAFGDTVAKAPVTWQTPVTPDNPDGSRTYNGTGVNAAFVLPKAATYAVSMPKQFTLIPTNNGAALPLTATCTSAAPAQIGSITLDKQQAKVKVKAPKSVKKGAVVTLKVTVSNDYSKTGGAPVTGKVTVKDGKNKVGKGTIKNGKVNIKVKGLKVGTHNLVVSYAGDGFTDKGKSKKLKVTVKS